MSGVIVFGLAAFMPFVVFKLLPVAAAAVVAQGVASAPMRAGQQGMQMQYYGRQLTSGGKVPGKQAGASAAAGGGGGAGARLPVEAQARPLRARPGSPWLACRWRPRP